MGDRDKIANVILGISVRVLLNVVMLFVLVQGFGTGYRFSYKLFSDIPYRSGAAEEYKITIEEGSSVLAIGTLLEERGVVDGRYLFAARAYLGRYNGRMLAGTYTLGAAMSPDRICQILCGMQSEETS